MNSEAAAAENDTTTVVGAVVAGLAAVSVALRFYARHLTRAGYKWDDWLILLALLTTIATDILVLWASSVNPNGAAVGSIMDPNYQLSPADMEYIKLGFIATVLYFTITSATKLSILLMYNRLFSVDVAFRRQVLVVGALVLGFWIGCTIADLLSCIPLEWTWLNTLEDPKYCINYNVYWMASGCVEAFIDLLIILMPIRVVYGLQLNLSKKIAVGGVFLLGAFVLVTGLIKVILSYVPGSRNPSFTHTEVWTTVHCCIGIVCACLPVCWPLFVRFAKLMPGSKRVVSSIRKRIYKMSGWSSMDPNTLRRTSSLESRIIPSNRESGGEYVIPMVDFGAGSIDIPIDRSSEESRAAHQGTRLTSDNV